MYNLLKNVIVTVFISWLTVITVLAQPRKRPDPVYIDATENTIVRSFIDLPGNGRVTHSVNVGSPTTVHYTYDMDKGAIVALWKGDFLNASSMLTVRYIFRARRRGLRWQALN